MKQVSRATFAVAISCALLACAVGPHKSEARQQADREVAARVQAALDADQLLYAKHIFVRADDGVVHLSGYVWEPPELAEATQVAAQVAGVIRVVNDLELQRNGSDNSGIVR